MVRSTRMDGSLILEQRNVSVTVEKLHAETFDVHTMDSFTEKENILILMERSASVKISWLAVIKHRAHIMEGHIDMDQSLTQKIKHVNVKTEN